MAEKKQRYIYVARDIWSRGYKLDIFKMKFENGIFQSNSLRKFSFQHYFMPELNLKEGEQKRVPILVDKAEVV